MTDTVLKRDSDYDDIARAAARMAKRMNVHFVVDERKAREFSSADVATESHRNSALNSIR